MSLRRAHFNFVLAVAEKLIDGYAHGSSGRQALPHYVPLHNFNGLHIKLAYSGEYGGKAPKSVQAVQHREEDTKWTPSQDTIWLPNM